MPSKTPRKPTKASTRAARKNALLKRHAESKRNETVLTRSGKLVKKTSPKKKSVLTRLGEAQTKAMSARPGAYQTHKGGPIMMRGEGWVDDPVRHAADKISKYLRSRKLVKKTSPKKKDIIN